MLDYMITLHVLNILTDANPKEKPVDLITRLDEECCNYLADGIRRYFNDIDRVKDKVDEKTVSNIYNNLYHSNPHFFEPYLSKGKKPTLLKKFKVLAAAHMFEAIDKSRSLKLFSDVYIAYSHYSKYDHFGIMFYDVSRSTDASKIKVMDLSIAAFPRLLLYNTIVLHAINSNDSFLKEMIEKTKIFIRTALKMKH
jgi:hypothetical protein